jgi:signal transduction histidine kinase
MEDSKNKYEKEAERLFSIAQKYLLETSSEESFDSLTFLASYISKTPIAFINFVDNERQWFKSTIGLSSTQTVRATSFSEQALKASDLFIVPDTLQHTTFATNSLVVKDPHIRFYAGMPLISTHGYILGSLNIMDVVPRELSIKQQEALRILAYQAVSLIELRFESKHQESLNAQLRDELAERKGIWTVLTESHHKLSRLISNLPGMVYRCSNDRLWSMEFISEGSLQITGYVPDDLINNSKLSYADLIHKDDRERVWTSIQDALKERRSFTLTYRIITASREEKWVWEQGKGIFSSLGDLLALEGLITDITDTLRVHGRQQAAISQIGQKALSGVDIQKLLDEVVLLIAETLNVEYCAIFKLLPANQELLMIAAAGWNQKLVGHFRTGTVPDTQAGLAILTNDTVIVEDFNREDRFKSNPLINEYGLKSSASVNILTRKIPFGILEVDTTTRRSFTQDDIHFLQAVSNILGSAVERREVEERLRENEERFRTQYKNLPVPTYSWQRVEGSFILVDFNDAADDITQGDIRKYLGHKAEEFYIDRPDVLVNMDRCFEGRSIIKQDVEWAIDTTGKSRRFAISYVCVPPDMVMVHKEDITERKEAEETLRRFADQLTRAQEEERRRISRELHDDAGQSLATLDVRLQMLEQMMSDSSLKDERIFAELSYIRDIAQSIQQGLRHTAHMLHPSVLEYFGLVEALRSHLETVCANTNLLYSIEVDSSFPSLPSTIETTIYRIIQESITNIVKHAQAKLIQLRFKRIDHSCIVQIADDGIGFDSSNAKSQSGIGLISMRERAQMIQAKLDIKAEPSVGTLITLSVPLNRA